MELEDTSQDNLINKIAAPLIEMNKIDLIQK
jgi:hypothetical protein